jgi:hypothetical protein
MSCRYRIETCSAIDRTGLFAVAAWSIRLPQNFRRLLYPNDNASRTLRQIEAALPTTHVHLPAVPARTP